MDDLGRFCGRCASITGRNSRDSCKTWWLHKCGDAVMTYLNAVHRQSWPINGSEKMSYPERSP